MATERPETVLKTPSLERNRSPAPELAPAGIAQRKSEHVDIVLKGGVSSHSITTGLEHVRFEHCALPELDLDSIDISLEFLGRRVSAPLIVSSMTGGPLHAQRINLAIAEAAGNCGIGFAVGSQRIALEGKGNGGLNRRLRDLAGPVPILANFGAAQLHTWNGADMARRAVEMIDADALIIHLNPLQEAVQAGGDRRWSGLLAKIETLARSATCPIVIKEVGAGLSGRVASQLWNSGITVFDVAGSGGTSWAAVEARRAPCTKTRAIAEAFRDWGIPTADAIRATRQACPDATIIASGGIRDGIDVAKSIRLGADVAGQAAGTLSAAMAGTEALKSHISVLIEQLRIACFCTGSANLAALRRAPLLNDGTDRKFL